MNTLERPLGEIETVIIGAGTRWLELRPDEVLVLERDPQNRLDGNAVRVLTPEGDCAGYLPRRIAYWLGPLLDAGKVQARGRVRSNRRVRHGLRPMALELRVTERGRDILDPDAAQASPLGVVHAVVLRAYTESAAWEDARCVQEMAALLRRLSNRDLLPETELLLALLPSRAQCSARRAAAAKLADVRSWIGTVRIGHPMHHHNLTLFPLFVSNGHTPPYVLLVDAIARGDAEVTEVSDRGSVPELKVVNHSLMPLLIPEGEILTGAKQNRVVNASVLVAAQSEFVLPVSCVEQGRWSMASRHFQASHYAPMGLRAMKTAHVRTNRAARGSYASDQGAIWDEVACRLDDAQCDSRTASLTDGYQKTGERTRSFRETLFPPEDCAGMVVATKGKPIGLDLFDSPLTLHRLWPRLSESYFMEGARNDQPCAAAEADVAKTFLDIVATHLQAVEPPLGIGTEVEVREKGIAGAGVYYEGRIVHLAAFTT